MEESIKNIKGITLISLVITIIVLLILANVSISMLIGENGILTQAQNAKNRTEEAKAEEEEKLNLLNNMIQSYTSNTVILDKTVEELKDEGSFVKGNTLIKDDKGNKVLIPDGFKIATDSAINVAEGIVIEDNDSSTNGNGEQKGNQFVWIPVSNINQDGSNKIIKENGDLVEITLGRYIFSNTGEETLIQKGEDYAEEKIIRNTFKELAESIISNESDARTGTNTTARNLLKFINGVQVNGGFYIARYEASYRDGIRPYSKVSLTASEENKNEDGKLWNWITQPKAAEASKAMYNNSNFETDLINSYAWDTTIIYIQKCSSNIHYSIQNSLNTSINNTGKNNDEFCKINDMASNIAEWETENSTIKKDADSLPCTMRGGSADNTEINTARRDGNTAIYSSKMVGFRPILYF